MKGKVFMFAFIVILGTVLTTALVGMDTYTAPMIQRNQELKRKITILKAFEMHHDAATIESAFRDNVRGRGEGANQYYISKDGMIAFLFEGSGLWGPISGVLCVQPDAKTIHRIEIMHQEETPGLGSRIAERPFLDRFQGKMFTPGLTLTSEGKAKSPAEVDGITGATMSSKAFVAILNAEYARFSKFVAGE